MLFQLQLCMALLAMIGVSSSIASVNDDTFELADTKIMVSNEEDSYLSQFPAISRDIIGRADSSGSEDLQNNVPATANAIEPGNIQFYRFPSEALHGSKSTATSVIPSIHKRNQEQVHDELRKRADDVAYFLSLSVCSQPISTTGGDPPPQLVLFVSHTNPAPDGSNGALVPPVTDGFSSFSETTSGDIFIGIQALSASGYTGSYKFELVVSIDQYYANYEDNSMLYWIDSDDTAGMFVSGNLTQLEDDDSVNTQAVEEWNKLGPRFNLYVANQADAQFKGIMRSYCALRNTTQPGGALAKQADVRVETGLTSIGGPSLQQQFYLSGLQSGSSYVAAMGLPTIYSAAGSGQPGGGGILYKQLAFTTKTVDNCKIVYNMTFCPKINYAVPFNPNNPNTTLANGPGLTAWYNNETEFNFQYFQNALQQVACNTSADAQYSLAVNCDDCTQAYKDWLCTVVAPRCDDFSSTKPYLHARAVGYPFVNGSNGTADTNPLFNSTFQDRLAFNSSRYPNIDTYIQPGPYKELLPCGDVCYKLQRACPASMGFACPYTSKNYNSSYGHALMDGQQPQCNYPGRVFGVSAGSLTRPSIFGILLVILLIVVNG